MADLPSQIAEAKKGGYSDAEIAAFLSKDPTLAPKIKGAKAGGYSDAEVISFLGKPNVVKDVAKSGAQGLAKGVVDTGGIVGDIKGLVLAGVDQLGDFGKRVRSNIEAVGNARLPSSRFVNTGVSSPLSLPDSAAINNKLGLTYTPQTEAGRVSQSVGMMAPNAVFGPAGGARGLIPQVAARTASVIVPGVASEGARAGVEAMGGGSGAQGAANLAGAVVGGGLSTLRTPQAGSANATGLIASRAGENLGIMRSKAADMRSAGVEPALIDVMSTKGQRLTRAAGVTHSPAGDVLDTNSVNIAASTKPKIIERTRRVTADPRTADQVLADTKAERGESAATNYAEPYKAIVSKPDATGRHMLDPKAAGVLNDATGKGAIGRALDAAEVDQDTAQIAELKALQNADGSVPVSAGTLDRVRIAFREMAAAASAEFKGKAASGYTKRKEALDSVLDAVPELKEARADYKNKSQAMDVIGQPGKPSIAKDPFSSDPTDYAEWHAKLSPEAKAANAVKVRQNILDSLGPQRSGTMGTADTLASSSYAEPNLITALGEHEAQRYLANVRARLVQNRNAQFVAPRSGSRTAVLEADTAKLGDAIKTGVRAVHRPISTAVDLGISWLRARGMSEAAATQMATDATDPAKLDAILANLEKNMGKQAADGFKRRMLAASTGALALSAASQGGQ